MSKQTFSPIETYNLLSDHGLDLRIIPCHQIEGGEKLAPSVSWKDKRKWGQEEYREWLSEYDFSGYDHFAFILPDDLLVIDLDVKDKKNGIDSLMKWMNENDYDVSPLKNAPKVVTATGGFHLYFKIPEGKELKKGSDILGESSGVDVQAGPSGALVFIPPSYRNQGSYEWEDGRHIATTTLPEIPEWIHHLCGKTNKERRDREPVDPESVLSGVDQGARNETLFRYCCRLRTKGYEKSEAVTLAKEAAQNCSPPYPSDGEEPSVEMVERVWDTYPQDGEGDNYLSQAKAAIESAQKPTDLKPAFDQVFVHLDPLEVEEIRTMCKEKVGMNVTTFDKTLKRARRSRGDESYSILDKTDVGVVGETESGSVVLYSGETGRIKAVNSIDDLTYNDSVHLGGASVEENITPRPTEEDPRYPYGQFKREIVKKARSNPLGRLPKKGQGIHRIDDKTCLIVSGSEAAAINTKNGSIKSINGPVWEDERENAYFVGLRPGSQWCEIPDLWERIKKMGEINRRHKTLRGLAEIISQWDFKNDMVDELVLMGGILQTICQDWPEWRPHYGLIAEQSSGKTTLFQDVIKRLLGKICHFHSSGTTEAGMRQSLHDSDTGSVDLAFVIRDEFEQLTGNNRQKILDWMRAANRGGTVTKGTAGQAQSMSFRVSHSFWIGTTEFGGEATAADWSRLIRMYLNRPDPESVLDFPPQEEIKEMGLDLIALSISVAEEARSSIPKMVNRCSSDAPRRMKENHAAPLAFLQAAAQEDGLGEKIPSLQTVLETRSHETRVQEDSQSVLNEILSHRMRVDISDQWEDGSQIKKLSVGQIIELSLDESREHLRQELESVGIRPTHQGTGNENTSPSHLFLHPGRVSRYCLQNTIFSQKNIRDYLLDLPGSDRSRRKLSGLSRARGVLIPVSSVIDG